MHMDDRTLHQPLSLLDAPAPVVEISPSLQKATPAAGVPVAGFLNEAFLCKYALHHLYEKTRALPHPEEACISVR